MSAAETHRIEITYMALDRVLDWMRTEGHIQLQDRRWHSWGSFGLSEPEITSRYEHMSSLSAQHDSLEGAATVWKLLDPRLRGKNRSRSRCLLRQHRGYNGDLVIVDIYKGHRPTQMTGRRQVSVLRFRAHSNVS